MVNFAQGAMRTQENTQLTLDLDQPFLVVSTATLQDGIFVIEMSRPLSEVSSGGDWPRQARRFEVFLCVYNETKESMNWFIHTTTAGETSRSLGSHPEVAWTMHPTLPILAWMVAGQKLRISRTDSHLQPLNLTGMWLPVPTTDDC